MLRKIYDWCIDAAHKPYALWVLGMVSFAESSFFPIPPDVVLVPMALAKPKKALWYAFVCTLASVAGGIVGYGIGYLLYDSIGKWLIQIYGYGDKAEALRVFYSQWGWLFILIKGMTPIPYKLVTIVSGLLEYNFALFVLLSIITRGARFFLIAGVLNFWGDSIKALLEKHFATFMVIILACVVGGFWLAAKMF